jgi:transcription-repair coupling factor (superfamily II helicase)
MDDVASIAAEIGQLAELPDRLEQHPGFSAVVDALQTGRDAAVDGVWGSARALLAAALGQRVGGPLVVVCPLAAEIDTITDDLALFSTEPIERFPVCEAEGVDRLLDETYGERLRLLKLLAVTPPRLIIASIQSLMQPVPTKEVLAAQTRQIHTGEDLDAKELAEWLVERGFHATSAVQLPGEFSIRGGIIDLFAPDWFDPVRIELFGDQVDSIRRFEVASQRSLLALSSIDLSVLDAEADDAAQLASHLPVNSCFLLLDPVEVNKEGKQYRGLVGGEQPILPLRDVLQAIAKFPSATAESIGSGEATATAHLQIESVERFSGDIAKVRDELDAACTDQDVHLMCETEAEAERLGNLLAGTQLAAAGRLHFPIGRLHDGFCLIPDRVVLVSGAELFHRADVVRPVRRKMGRAIDSFLELRSGDLVVHLAHGVGRYRGLKLLEKDDQAEEHLELEFRGGTKVFVPASKIDLVQKYVGGAKANPSLAKVGGKTWVRQKEAALEAVTDLASDMIEMQAARESRPGITFPPDSLWQQEFDASFPYQETPDQLAAIRSIKSDMHQHRPMDRLLCGDVGFGKTEMAIRAAFKAVDAGYQVAVLVPTTVLAEQHLRTFSGRMAEFPFEVASLSRFSTKGEQSKLIKRLKAGVVDVVIGTHRLVQPDVSFENLGLVIIDEEQRFGVDVKERLKAIRQTVDVLTMTATPIPRTLHLSLLGVRDISNLETPPKDRTAIETRVARFQEDLIRHAILRELNRGGQIYFVHNRVHDIEQVAAKLRAIVPEATLDIGHGQMPGPQLEDVMCRFVAGEFDILLATTIVESGLDIPNANTIFIDDADRYGLADLHQLRGRVGRYKHRAYCYLLLDPARHLSADANRRMRAIEEFSDMGAGFAIAMRDLELRGAGAILGTQQSGHISTVGYELYCSLLEQAVRRLQKQPPKEVVDVNIDLPFEAYLPRDYVPDMRLKVDLYRRLARIANDAQLREFSDELVDRFGAPPPSVQRLLSLAQLRIWAHYWRIKSIHREDAYLVMGYTVSKAIKQLAASIDQPLRIVDGHSAYLPAAKALRDRQATLDLLGSVLRPS